MLLLLISFLIVGFGQPSINFTLGIATSAVGFALFFKALLEISVTKHRFWTAFVWFFCVHALHLSWMTTHPFLYIYVVIALFSVLKALQFAILSIWIRPSIVVRPFNLFALAGLWTFFEWTWLFFLGGYTLNQSGIALSGSLYAMQLASVGGSLFLTFWVWLTNLFFIRSWGLSFNPSSFCTWILIAIFPYLFGFMHYEWHSKKLANEPSAVNVLLVNTDFPVEAIPHFQSAEEARLDTIRKWGVIFASMKPSIGKPVDLIVLPEYCVSYGTYLPMFPINEVKKVFDIVWKPDNFDFFPPFIEPYAIPLGKSHLVTNAFFAQAMSNLFKSDVVLGLEDEELLAFNKKEHYNAALFFTPKYDEAKRYEKRILVPLGEYVPTDYLNELLSHYGTPASFTHGKEAKVFQGKVPFGVSICYEETCSYLMRENRVLGANLLVNLTNDGWFPDSKLADSHFDHARLRTVESGIPLVRACNNGRTAAVNSLGEIIGSIDSDKECESLLVKVPTYHYTTLYSLWGDKFILGICFVSLLGVFVFRKRV